MAVLVEVFSFIIKRTELEKTYPGGLSGFYESVLKTTYCHDGELLSAGYIGAKDYPVNVAFMENMGLDLASMYRLRVINITHPSDSKQSESGNIPSMDRRAFFDVFRKSLRRRAPEVLQAIYQDITKAKDIYHQVVYDMGEDNIENLNSLAHAYCNLGVYYVEKNDKTKAIAAFNKALKISCDNEFKEEINGNLRKVNSGE